MKSILYLSCHSVLEKYEVEMFHKLGYKIFSPGAYVEPANVGDESLRGPIPGLVYDPEILKQWHELAAQHPGEDTKDYLTKEFVDNFDIVLVMHLPRWIQRNWNAMKHKRVIWRTIGQSVASTEESLRSYRDQGLQIVRYSPKEYTIPGFIGADAMIRFGINPEDFKDWNGNTKQVITFGQSMKKRDQACNFSFFEEVTRPFPRKLFGTESEEVGPWGMGKVPYEQLKQEMRDTRVYFYTGTHPASYTLNFMEALMTGCPMVCIGPQKGNASYFGNHYLYEIPDLLTNGIDGYYSDNKSLLQSYIQELMINDTMARAISKAARTTAIKHFNVNMIGEAWKAFLE